MDRHELEELGGDFLDDLREEFSHYDSISIESDGVFPDYPGAFYDIGIDLGDDRPSDIDDDDIEDLLEDVIDEWDDYDINYDWEGNRIGVFLYVDNYDDDDDE